MSYSNFPPGVSDSTWNAPWNEPYVPEKDFEVTCSQSLSRTVTVTTSNYVPGASGVDYEYDVDGPVAVGWQDDDDTSDTNWNKEYEDCGYKTPLGLIQVLKEVLQTNLENGIVYKTPGTTKRLIEECDGWSDDETEYVKE